MKQINTKLTYTIPVSCGLPVCYPENPKIKMEKKLAEYDWSTIASAQDMDIAACILSDSILSLVNECFPQIKVRISSRDPPFMSPLVKHLCNLRNKQIKMGINPDLQNQINELIRDHQIRAVRQENKSTNKDHGVGGKQSIE